MIIHAGAVLTMDDAETVLEPGWVRVVGQDIVEVRGSAIAAEPGEERIDAPGSILMPGLVNTHCHTFQTLLRAVYDELPLAEYLGYIYRCGVELSRDDCHAGGMLGGLEAVRSGTTTLVDHHFLNRGNELVEGTIAGMRDSGVRTVVARTIMDMGVGLPEAIKEPPAQALDRVDALVAAHRAEIDAGELVVMSGPNTPGINASAEACIASAEHAAERGLRMSAHVAEYPRVREAVREDHGVDGVVRWLDGIGALAPELLAVHAVQVDDGEVDLLRQHGMAVSHNPYSNLFCGDRNAPVDSYLAAGLSVSLGTDGAANNNGAGVMDALRLTRLLQRARPDPFAITPGRGLRMATIDGARALGLGDRIGSIEPGKQADLAVVDLQEAPHMVPVHDIVGHTAHFAKGTDVRTTIVAGRVVMRDRELVGLDEVAAYARAQERAAALVARLG